MDYIDHNSGLQGAASRGTGDKYDDNKPGAELSQKTISDFLHIEGKNSDCLMCEEALQ